MNPPTTGRKALLRKTLVITACYGFVLFVLGIIISQKGPAFLDLQLLSGTDVQGGSFYVMASSSGYLCGSLLAGGIYGRIKVKTVLMFLPMSMAALFTALTPWCEHFSIMLLVHGLVSIFCALFETTANVEVVNAWEGSSASAMQFLSFMYSLGGIIGPLVTEPFLAADVNATECSNASVSGETSRSYGEGSRLNSSLEDANSEVGQRVSAVLPPSVSDVVVYNSSVVLHSLHEMPTNSAFGVNGTSEKHLNDASKTPQSLVHYAYLITAILTVIAALPFLAMFIKSFKKRKRRKQNAANQQTSNRKLPTKVYVGIVAMLSALYFCYTSVDDTFGQYLSMFVVIQLDWRSQTGAKVTSLYWGCSTVTKLIMVVLVRRIDQGILLLASTIGMVVSMGLFAISALQRWHYMIWVATGCLALSQSSVFGGGMAWADSTLLKLDGVVTSSVMIFASLGAIIAPFILGVTMKELSPMSFPYLLCIHSVLTFLLFSTILAVVKPCVHKKYGCPRPPLTLETNASSEEEATMKMKEGNRDENNHRACKADAAEVEEMNCIL